MRCLRLHACVVLLATKRSLGGSHNANVARRTELELSLKDLRDRMEGVQGGKAEAGKQFGKLQEKIKETQKKLG